MGLYTTHNCWHGPYSSFNTFRYDLARQIGIDLDEYNGYGHNGTKDLASIDHDLMPLFNHSDCDGILTPDECKKIARGLKSVLKHLNIKTEIKSLDFTGSIERFMKGCLTASRRNENVGFH